MSFSDFLHERNIKTDRILPLEWDAIYSAGGWDYKGSGPGSLIKNCTEIVNFLNYIIENNNFKSLLDLGCGDLQYISTLEKFHELDYTGVDCSKFIIKNHIDHSNVTNKINQFLSTLKSLEKLDNNSFLLQTIKNFQSLSDKKFVLSDIINYEQDKPYDIILCKDVFQHIQGDKNNLKLFMNKILSFKCKVLILISDKHIFKKNKEYISNFFNIKSFSADNGSKSILIKYNHEPL
jgi:trans-aconitate methyltransferase